MFFIKVIAASVGPSSNPWRLPIPKPGSREGRPLGIPTVTDRVVQTALKMVIEPIFESRFAPSSYGFRPGRGCKDALRRVECLLCGGLVHNEETEAEKDEHTQVSVHDSFLVHRGLLAWFIIASDKTFEGFACEFCCSAYLTLRGDVRARMRPSRL